METTSKRYFQAAVIPLWTKRRRKTEPSKFEYTNALEIIHVFASIFRTLRAALSSKSWERTYGYIFKIFFKMESWWVSTRQSSGRSKLHKALHIFIQGRYCIRTLDVTTSCLISITI